MTRPSSRRLIGPLILSLLVSMGTAQSDEGSQHQDKMICTTDESEWDLFFFYEKKLCVQQEVIGVQGENVTLPCMFTYIKGGRIYGLHLLLYKYYNDKPNVVILKGSTNFINENFQGRIQTVGTPSEGDGSVSIRDLKMEDEGVYVCGFEFKQHSGGWRNETFEASEGKRTTLRVDVRPMILDVWREFVDSSTSWRLLCEAEAKPSPNITWWNPDGLLVNGSEIIVSLNRQNESQIISSYNITGEDPKGNYTCLVENQHGAAKESVFHEIKNETQGITAIMLGCSTALILVILSILLLFCIHKKQRNLRKETKTNSAMDPHQNEEEEVKMACITPAYQPNPSIHFPPPEDSPDMPVSAMIET